MAEPSYEELKAKLEQLKKQAKDSKGRRPNLSERPSTESRSGPAVFAAPTPTLQRKSACRTCCIQLSTDARRSRWTQCAVCYWKDRMQRPHPIEDLLRLRSDVRVRVEALSSEKQELERTAEDYREVLRSRAPLWRRLSGKWVDKTLRDYWHRAIVLDFELRKAEDEHRQLERAIESVKKAKKRFLDAQITRNARQARERTEAEEHGRFRNSAINNLSGEFGRKNFYVQHKDYRRGNAVDNYFRNIEDAVLAAFNDRCLFCGATQNLTFDHYGLSKNEGGNFLLIMADKASIRLNIVVLCRSCNSAKAQTDYLHYFNDEQRSHAASCQQKLLDALLGDQQFLKLMNKWGLKLSLRR